MGVLFIPGEVGFQIHLEITRWDGNINSDSAWEKIWNKSKYHGKIFVNKEIKTRNQGNLEKKSWNLNLMSTYSFNDAL